MIRMKRLLITSLVLVFSVSMAELKYDATTGKLYSKGASRNVDQNEYNDLAFEMMDFCNGKGFLYLTETELATIFMLLRLKDTPAADRLIHDFEQLIDDAKKDIQRLIIL